MKFIKDKILIFLSVVLALFCLTAFSIAVRVSITMVEKKWQLEKAATSKAKNEVVASAKNGDSLGKLEKVNLYFNGKYSQDVPCFNNAGGEVYISLEHIVKKLGARFEFYSPDEMISMDIDGKKAVVKLWVNSININDQVYTLKSTPYIVDNMILIPGEIFKLYENFNIENNKVKKCAYINYYPGINQMLAKISLLRQLNGKLTISDVTDKNVIWTGPGKGPESYIKTPGRKDLIIKSGEASYILRNNGEIIPQPVDIKPGANLSYDGDCFYWVDPIDKTSFTKDIATGEIKQIGDFSKLYNDEDNIGKNGNWSILRDYVNIGSFKRVVFSNNYNGDSYGFIQRRGKIAVEGNVWFSPDRARVIFKKPSNEYFLSNADGTELNNLGEIISARWLNNNSIIAVDNEGKYIINRKGKKKQAVSGEWKIIGTSKDGGVLYQAGNELYREKNFEEELIMVLPWNAEYAFEGAEPGKYILVSDKSIDKIICTNGQIAIDLGKASSLLEETFRDNGYANYKKSLSESPDKKILAVAQYGAGQLSLNCLKSGEVKAEKLVLGVVDEVKDINMKWISNDVLLVNTDKMGWILDLKSEMRIYKWVEKDGIEIVESYIKK